MPEIELVATTLAGLENVLEKEIKDLGGQDIRKNRRAVVFKGSFAQMYKMNFSLRTALRILYHLKSFRISSVSDYYHGIYQIPWENFFSSTKTIAVKSVVNSQVFKNTHYAALKAKDAVVDRMRNKTGQRPDVDLKNPELLINIHVNNSKVDISLDSSGEPLYKRGYRLEGFEAPLNEVLAAGMIKLSGWEGNSDFIDPMCGSGTLPIEAAMIAKGIPPGIFRSSYSFQHWNDYDEELYRRIVEDMMVSKQFDHEIFASDISVQAMEATRINIKQAILEDMIDIQNLDFFETRARSDNGLIMINPPYGERIKQERINNFYKRIGDHLKFNFPGYTAWILSANLEALKIIGLKPSLKIPLINGKLDCRFNKYELFSGKRAEQPEE